MQVYVIVSSGGLHGVFDSKAKAEEAVRRLSSDDGEKSYDIASVTLNSAIENLGTWRNGRKSVISSE